MEENEKSLRCEDFGKKNCLNCEFFRAGLDGCDIILKCEKVGHILGWFFNEAPFSEEDE